MFLLLALLTCLMTVGPAPTTVQLTLTSSASPKGSIRLAVYDSPEAFAAERALTGLAQPLSSSSTRLQVEVPGPGTYVFAAFHDLNGNGKLDRNFFGIPSEPYGFTQTPPSKWRAPSFTEIATTINGSSNGATIALRNWNEY